MTDDVLDRLDAIQPTKRGERLSLWFMGHDPQTDVRYRTSLWGVLLDGSDLWWASTSPYTAVERAECVRRQAEPLRVQRENVCYYHEVYRAAMDLLVMEAVRRREVEDKLRQARVELDALFSTLKTTGDLGCGDLRRLDRILPKEGK